MWGNDDSSRDDLSHPLSSGKIPNYGWFLDVPFDRPSRVAAKPCPAPVARNPVPERQIALPRIGQVLDIDFFFAPIDTLQRKLRYDIPRMNDKALYDTTLMALKDKIESQIKLAIEILQEELRCPKCKGSMFETKSKHDLCSNSELNDLWGKMRELMKGKTILFSLGLLLFRKIYFREEYGKCEGRPEPDYEDEVEDEPVEEERNGLVWMVNGKFDTIQEYMANRAEYEAMEDAAQLPPSDDEGDN